jgi:hypothetical protein
MSPNDESIGLTFGSTGAVTVDMPRRRVTEAPEVVALFPLGFARAAWQKRAAAGALIPHFEGFDLFAFPGNARLLAFDLLQFIDRLARKYARRGIAGIVTANEQFGALTAALLGERLGLPHTSPLAVLACQHKAYFRERLREIAPEASVAHWALPYTHDLDGPLGLALPFYIKPIKATYSVLARAVNTRAELKRHLAFAPYERYIIKRLVQPFNDAFAALIGRRIDYRVDAHWLIAEEVMRGRQINLDGYVFRGEVRFIGCVDELMYPGTDAFLAFRYPSTLPGDVQRRARALAARVVRSLGFDHGFFNIEFFYHAATDRLQVIEINPRLASQLADLYEQVTGLRIFDMLVELAQGRDPALLPRRRPTAGVAASFVWRMFDGMAPPPPASRSARAWLARTYPDALLLEHHKRGHGLKREYKWLGSHRFATVNLGAPDEPALQDRYLAICTRLGWPAVQHPDHTAPLKLP